MVGTTRPLTRKQMWAARFFVDREGRLHDRALFNLAIGMRDVDATFEQQVLDVPQRQREAHVHDYDQANDLG